MCRAQSARCATPRSPAADRSLLTALSEGNLTSQQLARLREMSEPVVAQLHRSVDTGAGPERPTEDAER